MPNIPAIWLYQPKINTVTAGVQDDTDIVQLTNGNILVCWTSLEDSGAGSPPAADVIGQLFDPAGNKIGAEFRLNSASSANNEFDADLAAVPGGGFIVTYHEFFGVGSNIRLEEFDSNGVRVSDNSFVEGAVASFGYPEYSSPKIAASSATSAMILYDLTTASGHEVLAKVYNPTTDVYGTPFVAMPGSESDVVVLANGNYVVVGETGYPNYAIVYRIFNPGGSSLLGATTVSGTSTSAFADHEATVTALSGGGFVIAWTTSYNVSDVLFRVYDASGTEVGSGAAGAGAATNDNSKPAIVGLTDGTFVVAYQGDNFGRFVVEHFSLDGASLGSLKFAYSGNGFPSVVSLADGRFAVAFEDPSYAEISMEIFDTRDTPSDAIYGGVWKIGTALNDAIFGTGPSIFAGGGGLDAISYVDQSGASSWRYAADGSWTITTPGGGTDTAYSTERIDFSDRSVRLYRLEGEDLAGDFNGDARDDILLRDASGAIRTWETANGGAIETVREHGVVPYTHMIAGVGKFNSGATDDVVYRDQNGNLVFWSMNGTASGAEGIALPLEWHAHAVADFNGDGTHDILLRNASSNALVIWQISNFTVGAGGGAVGEVTGTWRLLGTGDFNGDNRDDMLWYNSANNAITTWQMNGASQTGGGVLGALDSSWSVQGIADFNGDGRDDILWRHTSGALAQWQMNGTAVTTSAVFSSLTSDWQIQNVGSYDTGNKADILLRQTTSGAVALWSMDGTTVAGSQILSVPNTDWWVL